MRLLALGLLTPMVMTAAGNSETTPPAANVVALVSCAMKGSLMDSVNPLSSTNGRYRYSAGPSRLPDGRRVTAVMLFGDSRALLLEGVISRTRVGVVNAASFQRDGSAWRLEETHAGPETARHVRALAAELAKKAPSLLVPSAKSIKGRTCVGVGIP